MQTGAPVSVMVCVHAQVPQSSSRRSALARICRMAWGPQAASVQPVDATVAPVKVRRSVQGSQPGARMVTSSELGATARTSLTVAFGQRGQRGPTATDACDRTKVSTHVVQPPTVLVQFASSRLGVAGRSVLTEDMQNGSMHVNGGDQRGEVVMQSRQTPALHVIESQSAGTVHMSPAAHPGQEPPQSTSVSLPLRTPSEQLGTAQRDPVQTPLTQSARVAQTRPSAQRGQVPPPQSVSVSLPFWAPSMHVGAAHTPPAQTRLRQSRAAMHIRPSPQGGHMMPPQSVAVSAPSCVPLVQLMGGGPHRPAEQRLVAQSAGTRHISPFAHGMQAGPPQSTSDSPALSAPSVHGSTTYASGPASGRGANASGGGVNASGGVTTASGSLHASSTTTASG